MKIYIFGLGPSRMAIDPAKREPDTEYWGLSWDDGRAVHYDRCFEMHDFQALNMPLVRKPDYWERIFDLQKVYVQNPADWEDLRPAGWKGPIVEYPLEMVRDVIGEYFCSSVSYMLGLAILERVCNGSVTEIGLYGCELRDEDGFAHERPNIEFLLGFAAGKGLRLDVSPTSRIFDRLIWQKLGKYDIRYPVRYGYVP